MRKAAGPALPIDAVLPDVVAQLRARRRLVLMAAPGAGKTTRVPLALLDAGFAEHGQIVVLEPRRVAARAAAATMARALGESVGEQVGYHVRFDAQHGPKTRILVVTEGILTRRLVRDPFLEGVSCVLLDEFHERSVHTDLALAFLRQLLDVRDDLSVVVMSATLDTAALSQFLHAPVVRSEGRPFPVAVSHVEKTSDRPLDEQVSAMLRKCLLSADDDGGDALVFLPGAPEIRRAQQRLQQQPLPGDPDVVPLYGALSPAEQDRAIRSGPRRRVVLATNIAETSLTLEGVTLVVDGGLHKRTRVDPRTGAERLETVRIALDNATQRAGRAGRVRPGRCVRLWTAVEHAQLAQSEGPELARIDLCRVVLDVLAFARGDVSTFPFFEAPPRPALERARALLAQLGATTEGGTRLTPRGEQLSSIAAHPRTASVLLEGARLGRAEEAAALCAVLDDDRFGGRARASQSHDSDLASLLDELSHLEQQRRMDGGVADILRVRADFTRAARSLRVPLAPDAAALDDEHEEDARRKRMLLAGFPDRVCRRRRAGEPEGLMVGGRGVRLARESGVLDASLFLALRLEGAAGGADVVRLAEGVSEQDIVGALPHLLSTVDEAVFDEDRQAMVGVRRRRFLDLVLEEKTGIAVAPAVLAEGLARVVSERFTDLVVTRFDDDARATLARLLFAARVLPNEEWPPVDDDALRALLPELCQGKRSVADLQSLSWSRILLERLPWPLRRKLDDEVPRHIEVPSGSHIAVDYAPALAGAAPVLAVRLQELFGLAETPRIALGRVPVVLHLLSPGFKPVQVTSDLSSFWRTTYAEVKRELRARYPKHSWPDNPWTAEPVAKGRRRS